MINNISTTTQTHKPYKKRLIKYATVGTLGAVAATGYALRSRTYYPKFIKKTEHKLALVQYMKNPYSYGFYGALLALGTTGLIEYIKLHKKNK